MKSEDSARFAEKALGRLAAALERGESDAMKAYLAMIAKFPRYSWRNQLLVAMQRPEATRVAGYRTWRMLNRQVRMGEKAVSILAPIVYRRREERTSCNGDAEHDPNDKPAEQVVGFRAAHVFDISQTDGDPLPEFAKVTGDPAEHMDRLKALVAAQGIELRYAERLGGADGAATDGEITLRIGLSPAEEFSTLVHELAHTMLHLKHAHPPAGRSKVELEAEAVAFVVCQAAGLDTNTASADYLRLYDGNTSSLAASLERIQQTAATIIEGIQVSTPATLRAAA